MLTRYLKHIAVTAFVVSSATSVCAVSLQAGQEVGSVEKMHVKFNLTPQVVQVASIPHLEKLLKEKDYKLNAILGNDGDIPRTYFANFPQELRSTKNISQKKEIFIHILLPMILHANELILKERDYILSLKKNVDSGKSLKHYEEAWLKKVCEKYYVKGLDFEKLLERVDIIPPSLALGQAIIESGWGGSYAAVKKNSPFGMTPRPQKVKAYGSLYESVSGYMLNLNRNLAYKMMRQTRTKMRKGGKSPDGHTLIGDMLAYSEQRKLYIQKVRLAIKQNELTQYDSLSLEPQKGTA